MQSPLPSVTFGNIFCGITPRHVNKGSNIICASSNFNESCIENILTPLDTILSIGWRTSVLPIYIIIKNNMRLCKKI